MRRMIVMSAIVVLCLLSGTSSAQAQVTEVPVSNAKGDFTTARVLGNRGYYRSTRWLVVDASGSLNCRATPNGEVKAKLWTGRIVTAAFLSKEEDAIIMSDGNFWLRVIPQDPMGSKKDASVCLVRANNKYIAPINEDFVPTDTSSQF